MNTNVKEARLIFFLAVGCMFWNQNFAFILYQIMKCDESFMFYLFPSDSSYHNHTSLLPFVFNNVIFFKI